MKAEIFKQIFLVVNSTKVISYIILPHSNKNWPYFNLQYNLHLLLLMITSMSFIRFHENIEGDEADEVFYL